MLKPCRVNSSQETVIEINFKFNYHYYFKSNSLNFNENQCENAINYVNTNHIYIFVLN